MFIYITEAEVMMRLEALSTIQHIEDKYEAAYSHGTIC